MSNRPWCRVSAIAMATALLLVGCRADTGVVGTIETEPPTTSTATTPVETTATSETTTTGEAVSAETTSTDTVETTTREPIDNGAAESPFSPERLAELERTLDEVDAGLTDIERDLEAD